MRHATEPTDQQAFFENDGDFSAEAARRFPFSAGRGFVFGRGKYPLSLRCRTPWIIKCYQTAEARAEALREPCGSRCSMDHRLEESL